MVAMLICIIPLITDFYVLLGANHSIHVLLSDGRLAWA
jgi:hypothetical protein